MEFTRLERTAESDGSEDSSRFQSQCCNFLDHSTGHLKPDLGRIVISVLDEVNYGWHSLMGERNSRFETEHCKWTRFTSVECQFPYTVLGQSLASWVIVKHLPICCLTNNIM